MWSFKRVAQRVHQHKLHCVVIRFKIPPWNNSFFSVGSFVLSEWIHKFFSYTTNSTTQPPTKAIDDRRHHRHYITIITRCAVVELRYAWIHTHTHIRTSKHFQYVHNTDEREEEKSSGEVNEHSIQLNVWCVKCVHRARAHVIWSTVYCDAVYAETKVTKQKRKKVMQCEEVNKERSKAEQIKAKTNIHLYSIEIQWVNSLTHELTMPASYTRKIERLEKEMGEKAHRICYRCIWTSSSVIAAIVVLYVIIEFCFVPVYLCWHFIVQRHFTIRLFFLLCLYLFCLCADLLWIMLRFLWFSVDKTMQMLAHTSNELILRVHFHFLNDFRVCFTKLLSGIWQTCIEIDFYSVDYGFCNWLLWLVTWPVITSCQKHPHPDQWILFFAYFTFSYMIENGM